MTCNICQQQESKKSTHRVEIVPVVLEKHENADFMSIVRVFGYQAVVRTSDWAGITRAAYLPPDSVVDVRRPEFAFLAEQAKADGRARIKAKKLRGVISFGLLVPAPDGAEIGDDVAEQLGVEHYEPAAAGSGGNRGGLFMGGEVAAAPGVAAVKYDVDAGRRYAHLVFVPGEPVIVSEKIHGANARYVFLDGKMYCGSRTEWKREYPSYDHVTVESLEGKVCRERAEEIVKRLQSGPKARNMWWAALAATPALSSFCEANPGVVVYGEVYGAVQDLNYGHKKGEVSFRTFDLMRDGRWLDFDDAYALAGKHSLPWVPLLHGVTPLSYDFDTICKMAEGKSLVPGANHIREGCVVRPLAERWDHKVGRVCLKWVGAGYLERSKEHIMEDPDEWHSMV